MKKRRKTKGYYIGILIESTDVGVFTTKTELAKFLNICVETVRRHLSKSNSYKNDKYIIWRDVFITKCRKGKALSC